MCAALCLIVTGCKTTPSSSDGDPKQATDPLGGVLSKEVLGLVTSSDAHVVVRLDPSHTAKLQPILGRILAPYRSFFPSIEAILAPDIWSGVARVLPGLDTEPISKSAPAYVVFTLGEGSGLSACVEMTIVCPFQTLARGARATFLLPSERPEALRDSVSTYLDGSGAPWAWRQLGETYTQFDVALVDSPVDQASQIEMSPRRQSHHSVS